MSEILRAFNDGKLCGEAKRRRQGLYHRMGTAVTVRELALVSVEFSEHLDGSDLNHMADTLIRHWRLGAQKLWLPLIVFSDNPEEYSAENGIKDLGGPTVKIPQEVRAQLAEWWGGNFDCAPKHNNNWHPRVQISGQECMLIDFMLEGSEICWAIFTPTNALKLDF
jgi:hypothetical protein